MNVVEEFWNRTEYFKVMFKLMSIANNDMLTVQSVYLLEKLCSDIKKERILRKSGKKLQD